LRTETLVRKAGKKSFLFMKDSDASLAIAEVAGGLAQRVLSGGRRAVAQAVSAVENREAVAAPLLRALFPHTGCATVLGITGSPGAGKSTLVEKLAHEYRRRGERVGILAVDPTSPFSGGALLGDRVRMQALATDPGIFVRSMATRGQLGGLAPTTHDAALILDAAGFSTVIIETVGVGQDEIEIAGLADATVLLLTPGLGDEIQAFKAGVMEIADLFVVNKADRPGADQLERELGVMLSLGARGDGWTLPIIRTVATTGEGIGELGGALARFREFTAASPVKLERRRHRWRARLLELFRQTLFERAVSGPLRDGTIDRAVEELLTLRRDPHQAVEEIIAAAFPRAQSPGEHPPSTIDHVGIAVESLARALPLFRLLTGQAPEAEETVAEQQVRVAAFHLGDTRLELLEGTEADSPVARFVARRGPGLHHLTLRVPDLQERLRKLEEEGVRLIDREPRRGAGNTRIAFLHPASTAGVLIELVER